MDKMSREKRSLLMRESDLSVAALQVCRDEFLGAYTRVLARAWPALQVCACTPGFVATDMTHGYSQADALKSTSEGAETPTFLVLAAADDLSSGAFYGDSQDIRPWCTQPYDVA